MNGTQRIISKHALILIGRGKTEFASQIFVYDHMREIRANIETFEVKVLMDYDNSWHRVLKIELNDKMKPEVASKLILDFYNRLLDASMKLSEEERKNLTFQKNESIKKLKEIRNKKIEETKENEQ